MHDNAYVTGVDKPYDVTDDGYGITIPNPLEKTSQVGRVVHEQHF